MAINSDTQIQAWLEGLSQPESKRRESIALAIAKTSTYDTRIIAALKEIALNDAKPYAREAAVKALTKIAEAHFAAGNDIRLYLEDLRKGTVPHHIASAPVTPVTQPLPTPIQSVSKPEAEIQPKPIDETLKPVTPELQPTLASVPVVQEPAPVVKSIPAPVVPPAPPAPQVPFDQWLLSERNIKFALYSGGFLLLLAGLIFVGVNWAYLPGIAKLGVTLAVTLGLYVGGILLIRRPTLKIGGTALIAIASGFLPLNFVVTHIYLTSELGVSGETIWFIASLVCGIVYAATALRTHNNLFTSFLLGAVLSGTTALMQLLALDYTPMAFGYGLMTLALWGAAYAMRERPGMQFLSFGLRIGAHVFAPFVFLFAAVIWVVSFSVASSVGDVWFALAAIAAMVVFYVLDDWRAHTTYARSSAALLFALLTAFVCTQVHASSIQTGLVLKGLAAVYILLGYFLQRGKKLEAGLPLYLVSALAAGFVTAQALSAYVQTPEHLALALVGDVVLLSLAAYLSRQVEFVHGAVWLVLAPVLIYGNMYLTDWVTRGLVFGVVLLVYTGIAFRIAPRHLNWAYPFLLVAASLSVLVPLMLASDARVLTPVLVVIALLYAAMAVRLNQRWLLLPAFAAINIALVSGARLLFPFDLNLARVVAFAFCAWAVLLFFGRRALEYLRLMAWTQPFDIGAKVNFGLVYLLAAYIALDDLYHSGFISQPFGFTLLWLVGLLVLTTYLYRRVEFLYAATLLLIAPVYVYADLYLVDMVRVGLALTVLMVGDAAVGYWLGRTRTLRQMVASASGAFLGAAVVLSMIVPAVLYPNYAVMTAVLVGIGLLYALGSVWLRLHWLSLAALVALNLALLTGVLSAFTLGLDIQRASAIGYSVMGLALCAGAVEIKRRGWLKWRAPMYLVGAFDLLLSYGLAFQSSAILFVAVSLVIALICFVIQWVEHETLAAQKLPPVPAYLGAMVILGGIYSAAKAFNLPGEYVPVTVAFGSVLFVFGGLFLDTMPGTRPQQLYGAPFRYVGLAGVGAMLLVAVVLNNPLTGALTFALAALAFGAHGLLRKQIPFLYAAGASLVVALWWLLRFYHVTEWQAYIIPLGIWCLVIGWSEARHGRLIYYQAATLAGLALLLVSALVQSLSNINYAVLLLIEGAAAFGIGVKIRSRIYVEAAILALVANGLAQFGPAFIDLPRWVQIGSIGSILLAGGLLALFRRQTLLERRREWTNQWRQWRP